MYASRYPNLVDPFFKQGFNPKSYGFRGLRTKNFTYIIDNGLNPNEKQIRYFYYQFGGGPILDLGSYYLSAIVNLAGSISSVIAL